MACVLLEMNLLQNILITAVFPEANPKRCQLQKKLTSVCVVVVQIDTQALCWLDRPEMGHKRVTVQQRLLRDWSMEMGGGHVGRLERQNSQSVLGKQGCLITDMIKLDICRGLGCKLWAEIGLHIMFLKHFIRVIPCTKGMHSFWFIYI